MVAAVGGGTGIACSTKGIDLDENVAPEDVELLAGLLTVTEQVSQLCSVE